MSGLLTFTGRQSRVIEIPLKDIFINESEKCLSCDPSELQKAALYAEKNGPESPLIIKRTSRGYELLSEVKTYYATKLAGMEFVPCIVCDDSDESKGMVKQIKQIHADGYDFFKEAEAIEKLISYYGMTQEDAALHLGKAQSTIANKLRLLRLTEEERELIKAHHLTERHARALLRLASPQERICILKTVIQHGFNVEKTEGAVDKIIGQRRSREPYRRRNRTVHSIRSYISSIMKALDGLEASGVNVDTQSFEFDNCMEFRLRIPNSLKSSQYSFRNHSNRSPQKTADKL